MSSSKSGYWEVSIEKQGRLKLPSGLMKLLSEEERKEMWINHGFGDYAMLWTAKAFGVKMEEINKLNPNDILTRKYRNAFLRHLTRVEIDTQDRFVIPKPLQEAYNLKKDIVLVLTRDGVEVWSYDEYYDDCGISSQEFSELNQSIFGSRVSKQNDLENLINEN